MWTSPYPPVEVGGTTLPGMVLEAAARHGDRTALVDGPSGTPVSYRLLAERVQGVAAGLAAVTVPPAAMAPRATPAHWGRLGAHRASTSPGRNPRAASPAATPWTRSASSR